MDVEPPDVGGRSLRVGRQGPDRQAAPVDGILADQAVFVIGLDEDAIAGILFQVLESITADSLFFLDNVPGIGRILFFRNSNLVDKGIVIGRGACLSAEDS